MQVGIFTIPEGLLFPRTYTQAKYDMRALARSLDLDLEFVHRKRDGTSYCDAPLKKALVVESLNGRVFGIAELVHRSLHECAHFMDYYNGLFKLFWPVPDKDNDYYVNVDDYRRLALRMERHADWLADRMMWVMYERGRPLGSSFYDNDELAREFLMRWDN